MNCRWAAPDRSLTNAGFMLSMVTKRAIYKRTVPTHWHICALMRRLLPAALLVVLLGGWQFACAQLMSTFSAVDMKELKAFFNSASHRLEDIREVRLWISDVTFADNTRWSAGDYNVPDPVNPQKWIKAEKNN